MLDDLANGKSTPYPTEWLKPAAAELGEEIERIHRLFPTAFPLLGFHPDYLMNGEEAVASHWSAQLGGEEALLGFVKYYYWRSWQQRPVAFLEKIIRQMTVFYSPSCPAFVFKAKFPLGQTFYATSASVLRAPDISDPVRTLPCGSEYTARTDELAGGEIVLRQAERLRSFNRWLAGTYLPVLFLCLTTIAYRLATDRLIPGGKIAALLVLLFFLANFGNVLAISVVHTMQVQRYSTVQFATALFAQLWGVRWLIEAALAVGLPAARIS